jgi:hypothetical protein
MFSPSLFAKQQMELLFDHFTVAGLEMVPLPGHTPRASRLIDCPLSLARQTKTKQRAVRKSANILAQHCSRQVTLHLRVVT